MSDSRLIPYFGKFQPQLFIKVNEQLPFVGEKRDVLVDFKNRRDIELDPKLMISGKVRFIITGKVIEVDDKYIFDVSNPEEKSQQLICIWWKKPEIGFWWKDLDDLSIRTWQEESHSGNSGYDYIILPNPIKFERILDATVSS